MRCDSVRRRICELADGSLPAQESVAIRSHCDACEECGRQLREWERLREAFGAIARPPLPRSVAAEAVELARARRSLFPSVHPILRGVAVGGALAAIAVIALLRSGGEPAPNVDAPAPRVAAVVQPDTFDEVLPGNDAFEREHAMFARSGTSLDRNLWMVATTEASLSLIDD